MNSSHLENLNLNSSARDIEDYFERFEIWWFTQSRPVEEKKSAFFLNSVGREAYTLIKNLSFPTAPISVPYENIKSLLLRHVKPANFEATERAKFHSMVRDTNQGIRDFILQLLTQAAKCNFDDLDMQLKDRLIAGINDSTLQNELLRIPKPTFTEVRAHCEQFQDIRSATTDVPSANNSSSSSVMFHSTKRRQPRNANARPFKSGNNISSEHHNNHTFGKCASCGKFHSRLSCRFRQAVCHKCGKTGHIQSVCRSHKSCRFADSHDREVINTIVQGIDGVECYQDDVIVHAPTKVIHDERLLALFRRFHEKNVAVNSKKCAFSVSQFECLGYIVDVNGFRPDPNRLKPLSEACSPSDIRELRSLIGALQYYSRFIPNFSQRASLLFELLSAKKFEWCSSHEHCLREILNLLHSAVIRPFSPKLHSQLITDASPDGIGAVLEQNGRPVICVSRRLSQAEKGYAQTTREALAIYWSVKRLHKYLFGTHFTIVTDHQALKFIFDPNKSLSKSSAAMVQRWSIALSAYDYSIEHRSAKHIQHVDYISRQSLPATTKDDASSDSLLVQPLPVSRQDLIRDTRRYFGSVMVAVKKGWNAVVKRKFPFHYARRDELSVTPDGLLCANDRVVIPPTLRKAVLDDLHSGHLGVEKMKSLARMTCWWPHIDVDINRTAKNCTKCLHKMKNSPSNWIPWPMSTEVWQRVHADYCGPFLGKYYALIVIDSYSKWPEVFFTSSASAEFTIHALRKVFSREGVPSVLVTDNGTHFTADSVKQWLNGIGCRQLFTAARHPCSNGQAENFVKTLKSAIYSLEPTTFRELENGVDNFMLQYRNAVHCATKQSPARLFKGRSLRSNLLCLDSSDVTFFRGNDLRPSNGIILQNIGRRMCKILDTQDLTIHNRHVDQIRISEPGESVPISEVASESNSPTLDSVQTENDSTTLRRSARLNTKPRLDYNNPVVHSRCGECDE